MVRAVLDYIRRNYLSKTVIKQRNRAEATRVTNFPYEAIEEAVVTLSIIAATKFANRRKFALRPSSYSSSVILALTGAHGIAIRVDQLRTGRAVTRRYRNRHIGEFLKELDLTAPSGHPRATGIPKILNAMQRNGSPLPEFESGEERTYFLVRLPVHPAAQTKAELTPTADEAESRPSQQPIRSCSFCNRVKRLHLKSRLL